MKTIVYYHADCPDGLTAAWVLSKVMPDATFVAARFDAPPEVPPGYDRVIFADVAYGPEFLDSVPGEVVVLDHHRGTWERLEGSRHRERMRMDMSGAGLAYDYTEGHHWHGGLHTILLARLVVKYAQDRDLWQWQLSRSHEVAAYVDARVDLSDRERGFADLDDLATLLACDFDGVIQCGAAVIAFREKMVAEAAKRSVVVDGVAFVCCDPLVRNDVADALGRDRLTVAWNLGADGMVRCSVRGPGAREFAMRFGGNGHDLAAGCSMSLGRLADLLSESRGE